MDQLSPQLIETILHYALGIAGMMAGSRIIVALIQRRDYRGTVESLEVVQTRLTRLEQATEWVAASVERLGESPTVLRQSTPIPLMPQRSRTDTTPH